MANFNDYFDHIDKKNVEFQEIENENANNLYLQNQYFNTIIKVLESCKEDSNKFSYNLLESDYDESMSIVLKQNKNSFKHVFEIEIEDDEEYQGAYDSKYVLRVETVNFEAEYNLESCNSGKAEKNNFDFNKMDVDFSKKILINCFNSLYDRQ